MRNVEARIQAEIVAMIRASAGGVVGYAILNDGLFSKSEAAKRKWMGLLPGCPDLGLVGPGGRAMFLEVKAPGGRLSLEQVETIGRLEAAGARVAVVRSVDEARAVLAGWGLQVKREAA